MEHLHKARFLMYTPNTSCDDSFILEYAAMHGAVVVSRDKYRDLVMKRRCVGLLF